jgi:spore maturation protein CgeB
MKLDIVIFGLSITSSWGNGHATTYRALARALTRRGHKVTFLERDVPWYREHRDLPQPSFCKTELYADLREVPRKYGELVSKADMVIVGSYVPDGAALCDWVTTHAAGVTAFYDIDTPVTLAQLESQDAGYITASLVPRFDLYLSFTGGPVLELIEKLYGSRRARTLYCCVEPQTHAPVSRPISWELGYLGTYSEDRQPGLNQLLLEAARRMPERRFVVAGAQYPADIDWPANVERIDHVVPAEHSAFYCGQRYTLNITRAQMTAAGFSPSVRLFEAAACGVPIISDRWPGLESIFTPGKEILTAEIPEQVLNILQEIPEDRRRTIGEAARKHVLAHHTADHRVRQIEEYYSEVVAERTLKTGGHQRSRAKIGAVA